MVDTSKLVPSGGMWLKPELVEELQRLSRQKGDDFLVKVEDGSGIDEKEFVETKPEGNVTKRVSKAWITVGHDGKSYKWSLSATANQILGQELGFETDLWVGVTLKPFVDVVAGKKTVKALVISKVRK